MTEPDLGLPRVYVTVPGVESLTTVVVMLRGAGAEITDRRREFVIKGPLTAEQASAARQLAEHRDNGNRLGVRVDPDGDLGAALDAMCPGGWDEDSFAWPEEDWHDSDRWWLEQQQVQGERRRRPATPAAVALPPAPADYTSGSGPC
jgi:hypothetical protein